MKSRIVLKNNYKGFTLIEILVVMGLVSMVLVIGSLVNINMYTRELRASEQTTLVATLQKARSRAMNNIYAEPHGVYFGDDDAYILFRGDSYDEDNINNEHIPRNPNIEIDFADNEIIFEQLSGNTENTGTITMSDNNGNEKEVVIEANGLITW